MRASAQRPRRGDRSGRGEGGERGRWGSKRERGGGAKRELVLRLTEDGGFKGMCVGASM